MEVSEQIGLALIAITAWMAFKIFSVRRKLKAAQDWHRARGEVMTSNVSVETSGTAENRSSLYTAKIRYRFEVRGREYTASTICVGGQFVVASPGKAQGYVAQYPAGKSVLVYYDPKNPEDAVLELREESSLAYLIVGALTALGGYYLYF